MKIGIRSRKDFGTGLIFVFFGVGAMLMSRHYPMGTVMRMGPAYFPSILGGLLALLGLAIALRGLYVRGEAPTPLALRPVVLVLGAVLAFALLVQSLGLVLAVFALVVISCLGGLDFRLREVAILYLVLAALALGLFVYGLGLPFKLWPV
jgi:NADH:ubiquinone oxidoreductase subunit 2 (subunit N)